MVHPKHPTPTADTDRQAAYQAAVDTSPFAQGFWAELGEGRRVAAIVEWAMTGGAK